MPKISSLSAAIRIKVRETTNPLFAPIRRLSLKDSKFTIISNNCWGGHVYRYYGLEYMSPTIGLYFYASDYIKFISNLQYYTKLDIIITDVEHSKHREDLMKNGKKCPIGVLDDVEVVFLHYKTPDEAYQKWTRRCKRINWNHIVYKFSEQNLCSYLDLENFEKLTLRPKFVFVSKDYGLETQVLFKTNSIGNVPDDTTNFRKYIKLSKFINGEDNFTKH